MNHHARRILTPGASRKRKERESICPSKPATPGSTTPSKPAEHLSSNWLLAGYMAHEFLTKGTLFGQKFDPARTEAVPLYPAEPKGIKPGQNKHRDQGQRPEAEPSQAEKPAQSRSYAEVAALIKNEGAHVAGVVNPTQLARWIRM